MRGEVGNGICTRYLIMVPKTVNVRPGQRSTVTRPDVKVGLLLVEARRRRNLSLEAVSSELKISVQHLSALEEGRLNAFPAEVYARGAFMKYAAFLGIENRSNQHAFQRLLTGAREYVPLRIHTPKFWITAWFTPAWLLAGCVAIIALGVGSYVMLQVSAFVALPALQLSQPIEGVISTTEVTVSGRADPAAVVQLNGDQLVLDSAGNFSTQIGLQKGINVLQLTATNAAGRTRTVQKDILVSSNTP